MPWNWRRWSWPPAARSIHSRTGSLRQGTPTTTVITPGFPKEAETRHNHSYTSLSGAISKLDATTDRIDSDIITYFEQDGRTLQRRVPGRKDGKFCGLIYLYSSRTGELLAIIHDGYLQKFRVAGTGAVGAKYLARKDSRTVGLIGTGWQAQGAAHCFAALGNLEKIHVYSPTPGKKETFADHMSTEAGIEIIPVPSAREAVRGADIVYMATNSKDPVVMADWLEPGQFVSNVSDVELEIAGWERCDVADHEPPRQALDEVCHRRRRSDPRAWQGPVHAADGHRVGQADTVG